MYNEKRKGGERMARLYEIINKKIVPYWLRHGLVAGVGIGMPTSEQFRVYKVTRIGRGHLSPVRCGEGYTLALMPECDRDTLALVIVEGEGVHIDNGRVIVEGSSVTLVELPPGGSIKVSGRLYYWDGRNLRKI